MLADFLLWLGVTQSQASLAGDHLGVFFSMLGRCRMHVLSDPCSSVNALLIAFRLSTVVTLGARNGSKKHRLCLMLRETPNSRFERSHRMLPERPSRKRRRSSKIYTQSLQGCTWIPSTVASVWPCSLSLPQASLFEENYTTLSISIHSHQYWCHALHMHWRPVYKSHCASPLSQECTL